MRKNTFNLGVVVSWPMFGYLEFIWFLVKAEFLDKKIILENFVHANG